jgi:hypothetical protein
LKQTPHKKVPEYIYKPDECCGLRPVVNVYWIFIMLYHDVLNGLAYDSTLALG